jgi:hypothetical protein
MASRFGAALILIGLISLVVFILTLQIQQANTLALLLGSSLTALGLVIRRSAARNAKRRTKTPNGSFSHFKASPRRRT